MSNPLARRAREQRQIDLTIGDGKLVMADASGKGQAEGIVRGERDDILFEVYSTTSAGTGSICTS
jgi:hypothetical protein